MSLLFDQNLSHRLVDGLRDLFPGATHVRTLGLERAEDEAIWRVAAADALTIVSKDDDFAQRALLQGPPPKVIWVQVGNRSTSHILDLLRRRAPDMVAFVSNPEGCLMTITEIVGDGPSR